MKHSGVRGKQAVRMGRAVIAGLLFGSTLGAQAPQTQRAVDAAQPARLQGSVRSGSGEPIPRATLRLERTSGAGPLTAYTTTADDNGNFVFEGISPWTYSLTARRPGYVGGVYGSRGLFGRGVPLRVGPGQGLTSLVIEMTPQSVIRGTVTDASGDPVQGLLVNILVSQVIRGTRRYAPAGSSLTDDQGEYRLTGLFPGRYLVKVDPRPTPAGSQRSGTGGAREVSLATYYGNAADVRRARLIELGLALEMRGMDIRLARAPAYAVSGRIVGPDGEPIAQLPTTITPKADPSFPLPLSTQRLIQTTGPDGRFSYDGLTPGIYVLQSMTLNSAAVRPSTPAYFRQEVVIAGGDVSNREIRASFSATVKGRVRLEGGDIGALIPDRRPPVPGGTTLVAAPGGEVELIRIELPPAITLTNADTAPVAMGSDTRGTIAKDGSILLEGLVPGRYGFDDSSLPARTYLKSARLDEQDAAAGIIDIPERGGTLEILLSLNSADLSGVVRTDDGAPLVGYTVSLWTKTPREGTPTRGVRSAYSDQNGAVSFSALPPGEYYVAAWRSNEAYVAVPEFLSRFNAEAAAIQLSESARQVVAVPVVPEDRLAEELGRL